MAQTPSLFLCGTIWTWRRRVPRFSTQNRHWQLSLRTKTRAIACIIARRLNYECDQMLEAISDGKLNPAQAKAWLTYVVKTELNRIERQRMISRMDAIGSVSAEPDHRFDWATRRAWQHMAAVGPHPELTERSRDMIRREGANDAELEALDTMINLLSQDVCSDVGVNKMLRAAKDSIHSATGEKLVPSAQMVFRLRQLLLSGKAAAWAAAEGREDPSLKQANRLAQEILAQEEDESDLHLGDGQPAAPDAEPAPVAKTVSTAATNPDTNVRPTRGARVKPTLPPEQPTQRYDPNLMELVTRINAEKDRDHIKDDTRKKLLSQAQLFIKATDIADITQITQAHLKHYKSVLRRLPTSYGKSAKDADRSIEDLLARADDLPADKVGLSARTINGHLDRFSLMFRVARSESLKLSDTLQLDLLRVPETKRNRDKREAFALPELKQLFQHPIWTGCANHKRRHVPGNFVLTDGLYWGPLMAAYNGARREEVLALAPDDVTMIEGIPCYHIRDNAHRGVKTLSSTRLIPIHSHLIEMGFLRHVEQSRNTGAVAIFPELAPKNNSQSFGDRIQYNWQKALTMQLAHNPRKLCFHSLRHYAISHLKKLPEITDKQRRDLVGHSGKDVHDEQYDVATSMPVMQTVVEKLPRVF